MPSVRRARQQADEDGRSGRHTCGASSGRKRPPEEGTGTSRDGDGGARNAQRRQGSQHDGEHDERDTNG